MNLDSVGILVVDDEQDVRDTLLMALPYFGFKSVFSAEDGLVALEILQQHGEEIKLVITDFQMPNMNGLELVQQISQVHQQVVGILMLTAFDQRDLKKQFFSAESDSVVSIGFMDKPYSISALVEMMIKALPTVWARRTAKQTN